MSSWTPIRETKEWIHSCWYLNDTNDSSDYIRLDCGFTKAAFLPYFPLEWRQAPRACRLHVCGGLPYSSHDRSMPCLTVYRVERKLCTTSYPKCVRPFEERFRGLQSLGTPFNFVCRYPVVIISYLSIWIVLIRWYNIVDKCLSSIISNSNFL